MRHSQSAASAPISLPRSHATTATLAFPTPLHHLACAIGSLWDEQKRALASAAGRVVFVPPPPLSADASLLSHDMIHPNAAGYTLWGQHLAQAAWSSR